jgi:hypothetical protein
MTITALPLFNAESQAFWLVDDTAMTLVSAADLPPGKVRQNMRDDLAKSGRLEVSLPCVHFSDSFLGISGTHVHGRGWKLHQPQGSGDLWEQAERASLGDWTEIAAH